MKKKKESIVILETTEIAIFFVIFLIITTSLATAAFILGTKYNDIDDTVEVEEKTNETDNTDDDIEQLKEIAGLTNENCYSVNLNKHIISLMNKGISNATPIEIEQIYNLYVSKNNIGVLVDNNYCDTTNPSDLCYRTTESNLDEFLKYYDFNYSTSELLKLWDKSQTDHTYHYIIYNDVNCVDSVNHNVTYWNGMGNDKLSPSEYITLSDEVTTYYDETPTIEKYNYIFKKTTSNKKSSYYLIKIEQIDVDL